MPMQLAPSGGVPMKSLWRSWLLRSARPLRRRSISAIATAGVHTVRRQGGERCAVFTFLAMVIAALLGGGQRHLYLVAASACDRRDIQKSSHNRHCRPESAVVAGIWMDLDRSCKELRGLSNPACSSTSTAETHRAAYYLKKDIYWLSTCFSLHDVQFNGVSVAAAGLIRKIIIDHWSTAEAR
jgi:hypothetical protein